MDVCGRKLFGKSEYVSVKEIQSRLKKVEERGGIWRKMVRSNGGREEREGGSTKRERETQKRSRREGRKRVSECVRACVLLCWYVPGSVTGLGWLGLTGEWLRWHLSSRRDQTGVAARKVSGGFFRPSIACDWATAGRHSRRGGHRHC